MDPLGDEEARRRRPDRPRIVEATAAFGGRWSPGSTSSSDTADLRDFAESSLNTVRLNNVGNNTRPQYTQREGGDTIDFDPATFENGRATGGGSRPLGGAASVVVHEATHAGVAASFDNHLGDYTNYNLPREEEALQASAARQMDAITFNMQSVGYIASIDGKISSETRAIVGQPARDFLDQEASGGVRYAQSLPHAEYLSVIGELKTEIRDAHRRTYRDSPTYRYLTRINDQARGARIGGQHEIQRVQPRVSPDQMTGTARRAHRQGQSQGTSR